MDEMADPPEHDGFPAGVSAPRRRRSLLGWIPSPLRHGLTLFVLLVFVEYVLIPSFLHSKARSSLSQLSRVNPIWLLAGFALEAGALAAYGRLTQSVLPKGGPPFSKVLRIDLSTLAVSHVLPGGTAGGTGLGYRLLTSNGVNGADAGFALATQGIGSAVVLNCMLWVALVISIPLHGFNSAYVTVAVVGAVLLAAFAALVLLFTRGEAHASRALRYIGRRVPWRHRGPDGTARAAARQPAADPRGRSPPPSPGRLVGCRELALRRRLALGLPRRLRAHHASRSTSLSPTAWPTSSPPSRSPRAASASSRQSRRRR